MEQGILFEMDLNGIVDDDVLLALQLENRARAVFNHTIAAMRDLGDFCGTQYFREGITIKAYDLLSTPRVDKYPWQWDLQVRLKRVTGYEVAVFDVSAFDRHENPLSYLFYLHYFKKEGHYQLSGRSPGSDNFFMIDPFHGMIRGFRSDGETLQPEQGLSFVNDLFILGPHLYACSPSFAALVVPGILDRINRNGHQNGLTDYR